MKKLKSMLDKALEVLLIILLMSMIVVAILGVFTRLIFKNQASFTTEFLRYALLWLSLFAAAYCFGEKGHIAITFVKDRLDKKALLALNIFIELIIITFALIVLIYGGYQGVLMGMGEISPTLHIKVGYVYMALPISGVFIVFYSLINLMGYFVNEKENVI